MSFILKPLFHVILWPPTTHVIERPLFSCHSEAAAEESQRRWRISLNFTNPDSNPTNLKLR
jgi:hypothetical protein